MSVSVVKSSVQCSTLFLLLVSNLLCILQVQHHTECCLVSLSKFSCSYWQIQLPLKFSVTNICYENRSLLFCLLFNRLMPNDPYMGRTAPLTSKRWILYIYSTNIGTEYFKHALYSPFFFSSKCSLFHNANLFGSCIIHILYTQCAKIKKILLAPKG